MEQDRVLKNFLDENGLLKLVPAKRSKKLVCLAYVAEAFERGRQYSEGEVNELINARTLFYDPATVRRELYDNRFLERERDGSRYWLSEREEGPAVG